MNIDEIIETQRHEEHVCKNRHKEVDKILINKTKDLAKQLVEASDIKAGDEVVIHSVHAHNGKKARVIQVGFFEDDSQTGLHFDGGAQVKLLKTNGEETNFPPVVIGLRELEKIAR